MLKTKKLRDLLNKDKLIYIMGAHNGLSAKLVEKNNFEAIWASGLEISASYAVPDANILTMTEYLEKSQEMSEAVNIPVISDCDTGYGNSNNVMYLVKKYEAAGIAAICIEDKQFPKVNSFVDGRQDLAPIAEFVGKIMAAKSVQRDKDFMLIARIEALIAGWGEDEALLRADKYIEAGADAILIHSKSHGYEEIISFAKKWNKKAPLVIVPTTYPNIMKDFSEKELLDLGIKMVIYANQGIRASIKAMNQVMESIRKNKSSVPVEKDLVSMKEVFELQGMLQMKDDEKKFLKSETGGFNTVFLAAGSPRNQKDLEPLLRDRPVAQLDINGKTLLERNIETLTRFNPDEITVVTGYHSEQFDIKNVSIIKNPEYDKKHILHSLMLAEEKLNGKALLIYADILFDHNIIERLLKCHEDIVIVGDATFKKVNVRNKKLDLLVADEAPSFGHRLLGGGQLKKVVKIGETVSEHEAHYEFAGLMLFNQRGIELFNRTYHELKKNQFGLSKKGKDFDQLTIDDVLQLMIDQKITISMLEVNSGWMEIHTFENYKTACSILAKKE